MERKTLEELSRTLDHASRHVGSKLLHKKSGKKYRIVSVHFRESDMAICYVYTPIGSEFYNRVTFSRTEAEMDFGGRFLFDGGPVL